MPDDNHPEHQLQILAHHTHQISDLNQTLHQRSQFVQGNPKPNSKVCNGN